MKAWLPSLVLGVLVVGLGSALFLTRTANADLAAQVTRLSRQNAVLRHEAKQAATQAEKFSRHAVELDTQLGSAKSRTTATEIQHSQLARELTQRDQREVAMMAELAALRQQAATDDDVPALRHRVAELEEQLIRLLTRALAETPGPPAEETATTPAASLLFQVVRVGPGDSFVVVDYGADHGAHPGQVLSLWRGTAKVGGAQISEVRPRFSLAQVRSATLKGQLQTGDLIILTH